MKPADYQVHGKGLRRSLICPDLRYRDANTRECAFARIAPDSRDDLDRGLEASEKVGKELAVSHQLTPICRFLVQAIIALDTDPREPR